MASKAHLPDGSCSTLRCPRRRRYRVNQLPTICHLQMKHDIWTPIRNLDLKGLAKMDDDSKPQEFLSLTTEIVGSFVGNNAVAMSDLPALIASVFQALRTAGQAEPEKPAEAPTPAVPIKKSVQQDFIVCLEDGKKLKMLKRHLATRYKMTPKDYRQPLGPAQGLPDGSTGLCRAALGTRQADRPWPEAGRSGRA